jgi:hypothetical protein
LYVSSVLVRTFSRIILHKRHSKLSLFCWVYQNRFSYMEKWFFKKNGKNRIKSTHVRILSNVVTVFRKSSVRREEIRQGKWEKWWNKYIFTKRSGERLWTKWRVTDCQSKCWTVDAMTVARLENLRREDKCFTKNGTGPIGPYRSKGVEEGEEADINMYYPCCINTVVTKCVYVWTVCLIF